MKNKTLTEFKRQLHTPPLTTRTMEFVPIDHKSHRYVESVHELFSSKAPQLDFISLYHIFAMPDRHWITKTHMCCWYPTDREYEYAQKVLSYFPGLTYTCGSLDRSIVFNCCDLVRSLYRIIHKTKL